MTDNQHQINLDTGCGEEIAAAVEDIMTNYLCDGTLEGLSRDGFRSKASEAYNAFKQDEEYHRKFYGL